MNHSLTALFVMVLPLLTGHVFASEDSPHLGKETQDIKALSQSEIDGLLSGKGMGYGKAAELNGYPGPAHVLELSKELSLTADQLRETNAVFAQMKSAAKDLGADLVAAERELDQAFKSRMIDTSSLGELMQKIGDIEARLRTVHLNAHLQQTDILNEQQIAKYMDLRGYKGSIHGNHHK